MKARAGVRLAIVTTVEVEVEVEFELQVLSIFQQIFKKGLNLNSKRALGLRFNCICIGEAIKEGDKPSKGGDRQLEPCVPPFPPLKGKPCPFFATFLKAFLSQTYLPSLSFIFQHLTLLLPGCQTNDYSWGGGESLGPEAIFS